MLLDEIKIGSEYIISKTKTEDILIFIGQSPNLFYHVVKHHRNSYELPFSGICSINDNNKNKDKESKMIFFSDILKTYNITKELFDKNIYLIDYSVSGNSIKFIQFLLNSFFKIKKIYNIIYWGYPDLPPDFGFYGNKYFLNEVCDYKILDKLKNFEYEFKFRTIPKYYFKSKDLDDKQCDESKIEEVLKILNTIKF